MFGGKLSHGEAVLTGHTPTLTLFRWSILMRCSIFVLKIKCPSTFKISFSTFLTFIVAVGNCVAATADQSSLLSESDFFKDIPVVLSATRLQQPVNEAPVATTIIDREMIEASGFKEIPDLLRLVPGFMVSYDSGHVIAAGYHLLHDRYVRHQQILIDGRSVYSPLLGGVNWSELPIVMDDIERIEVIRGPNASTYGSNSFLGVINIITRHASQDRGDYVKLSSGSANYRNAVYRHGSNIGDLDYRVTVNYRQDDGFQNRYDGKQVRVITTRGDYLFKNNDNLSFKFGYSGGPREEDNAIDPSGTPHHLSQTTGQFQQVSWRHNQSENNEYRLQLYHNFSHFEDTYPGTNNSNRTERIELELQNQIKMSNKLRLIWGGSTRTDSVASIFWLGSNDYKSNHIKRLFLNAEYQYSPQTLVNAGIMHEQNDTAGSNLMPRLSINHQVNDNNTLRLTISKATRAPVLFEEDPYYGGYFSGAVDLKPERITTYEIGYLVNNDDRSVALDTKIYYDDIKDLINYTYNGSQYYFDNFDNANIHGLETSLTWRPDQMTRIIANYSYTLINSTANTVNSEYGIAFPHHLISLLLIRKFSDDYKGSLGLYYRSETKPLARKSYDPTLLKPYTRVDMRLARKLKFSGIDSELSLTVQNTFDEVPVTRLQNYPKRQAYISWKMNFK